MRLFKTFFLLAGVAALASCTRDTGVDIGNNDSAALVDALRLANEQPGRHTIRLARNGLYILSREAEPGLLLPSLRGDVTIEGNHAEIRGYSAGPAAILQVEESADVRIADLLLAEGTDGAVRNFGELELHNVGIVDSSVDRMPAIVLNHGHLEAIEVEIAYNLMLATRRDAGTVLNYGHIEVSASRIHDNRVLGRGPSVAVAGGILNFGVVEGDGLHLDGNDLQEGIATGLSFGGILNVGNGRVSGATPVGGVRDARHASALAGS